MTSGTERISVALAAVRGKAIDRVFVVSTNGRFELFLVFTDATYYEFYGGGEINGARTLDKGNVGAVRELVARRGGSVVEIGVL
jgi:hypothetical protein